MAFELEKQTLHFERERESTVNAEKRIQKRSLQLLRFRNDAPLTHAAREDNDLYVTKRARTGVVSLSLSFDRHLKQQQHRTRQKWKITATTTTTREATGNGRTDVGDKKCAVFFFFFFFSLFCRFGSVSFVV
jgi:hypothetical protein